MAACPPFQFWISFLQFIILLLPHIAIPGAQCSLNADCYIKSIEMSGDYLVVGKCTTVWLWQLGARVTVAVKLRFLLEQRLGLDHVMYALELRLFKCRLCGKYCEGKSKNILLFFCCRFVRELPRVDAVKKCPRNPTGNSWKSLVWKVCASSQISHWELHAGNIGANISPGLITENFSSRKNHRREEGLRRRLLWMARVSCCS